MKREVVEEKNRIYARVGVTLTTLYNYMKIFAISVHSFAERLQGKPSGKFSKNEGNH